MRVSSLSDKRIIELVSRYFVPAWLSRDGYQLAPPSPEETALVSRIDSSRREKKLEGGAVCVYIVTAAGDVLATMTVQKASKPDLLAPFLQKIVTDRPLSPRAPAAIMSLGPASPRAASKDGRLFTVRTRFDDPAQGGVNRGTSRDVVELARDEWAAFLPPGRASAGQSWTIPAAVAARLLRHAYPPLPHWKVDQGKVLECALQMKVVETGKDGIRMELSGRVVLLYPHLGKPTDGKVTARLVGVARADTTAAKLKSLVLVSEDGQYGWRWQEKLYSRAVSLAIELSP